MISKLFWQICIALATFSLSLCSRSPLLFNSAPSWPFRSVEQWCGRARRDALGGYMDDGGYDSFYLRVLISRRRQSRFLRRR